MVTMLHNIKALYLATIIFGLTINTAQADDYSFKFTDGEIIISNPWARSSIGKAPNSAGFFMIKNTSSQNISLVGVKASFAKRAELHTHIMENNIMKMRRLPKIDISAKSMTALKPGSFHIMFLGLNRELNEGDEVSVSLKFDKMDEIKQTLKVIKFKKMMN